MFNINIIHGDEHLIIPKINTDLHNFINHRPMHYQLSNVAALVLPRVQNHNRVILEDSWNTNKETHYRDLISQHRPQDNVSISYWLCTSKSPCPILMWPSLIQTCLSHARRNVSMKSLPPKPPDWTYHTQPPAPPDQTSCVLATRFADHLKYWYNAYIIVMGTLGNIKNKECGTMLVLYDEYGCRYMNL
ncbi:unnamed protein product [Trifolium pratense]|uniref:Uncharacterized protein n=1 Tax=Trifolium pratense TaxID=57577 RepID=A0ACB0ISV0_TRIPR|nr:unnamed protein product [Trifolium pratense]